MSGCGPFAKMREYNKYIHITARHLNADFTVFRYMLDKVNLKSFLGKDFL